MSRLFSSIKDMFKSPEQREIEAKMEFNRNKRAFQKYYNELDQSIRDFTKMARDAELSGNHANAKSCASFIIKLQRTQVRVQGLLQRFEMMHSMQRLGNVYTRFVDACGKMGVQMSKTIDLEGLWKNTAKMEMSLAQLDELSQGMDEVFNTIDQSMSNGQSEADLEAEADEMLNKIIGRHNAVTAPQAPISAAEPAQTVAQAPQAVPMAEAVPAAPAAPEEAKEDPEEELLRQMLKELKG